MKNLITLQGVTHDDRDMAIRQTLYTSARDVALNVHSRFVALASLWLALAYAEEDIYMMLVMYVACVPGNLGIQAICRLPRHSADSQIA